MRKFVRYSYIAALLVTCAVICPFLLKDMFAAQDKSPLLDEVPQTDDQLQLDPSAEDDGAESDENPDLPPDPTDPLDSAADPDADQSGTPDTSADNVPPEPVPEPEPEPEPEPWAPPEVNCEGRTDAVYAGACGPYDFAETDASYFDDALFIGDSRTDGLSLYSGIENAAFFCTTGMNVFRVFTDSAEVKNVGTTTLEPLLASHSYGKIYLMLGINELGDSIENIVTKYYEVAQRIHELQPDAVLYIEGNLHVGPERSATDAYFNNGRINALNYEISKLADNRSVFYIDVNEYFDDESGNLPSDMTFDQVHLYSKYYLEWAAWLQTKAVLR